MGMFDEIRCKACLPTPPPAFVTPDHFFQTKSLVKLLYKFEISTEGRLLFLETLSDDELPEGHKEKEQQRWDDYHGDVYFYTNNMRALGYGYRYTNEGELYEHIEYRARFTNGKLQDIKEVCHETEPGRRYELLEEDRLASVGQKRNKHD